MGYRTGCRTVGEVQSRRCCNTSVLSILNDLGSLASGGSVVALEVAGTARAFNEVEHAIRHGLIDAVERGVDVHQWASGCHRRGGRLYGADRIGALGIVLLAGKNHC